VRAHAAADEYERPALGARGHGVEQLLDPAAAPTQGVVGELPAAVADAGEVHRQPVAVGVDECSHLLAFPRTRDRALATRIDRAAGNEAGKRSLRQAEPVQLGCERHRTTIDR